NDYVLSHVELKYGTTEKNDTLENDDFKDGFWRTAKLKCNPDVAVSNDSILNDELLRKVETSHLRISCEPNEQMIFEESGSTKPVEYITCEAPLYKY
ncbi:hypothetical protein PFISCL1PPCAC_994, partial [Pristionchus fissidentatus]